MVHLTYNATERRKMPSPLKIGLFMRHHSETPCIVCPKQSAAYPETPEQIERGLYHAITPEPIGNSLTGSRTAGTDTDRAGMIQRYAIQRRPIPTGAGTNRRTAPTESTRTDHAKPEQLATVSLRRIFRSSPGRELRPVHISTIAMQGSVFCGFSALISVKQKAGAIMPRLNFRFLSFCAYS